MEGPRRYLVLAARVLLGLVFVYAAIHKIQYPPGFAKEIFAYKLVPGPLVNLMAIYLPWLELFAGLALLLGPGARAGGVVTGSLLIVFLGAIGSRFARGEWNFECGCFPHTESFIDRIPVVSHLWAFMFSSPKALVTFARDLLLLALAGIVVAGSPRGRSR